MWRVKSVSRYSERAVEKPFYVCEHCSFHYSSVRFTHSLSSIQRLSSYNDCPNRSIINNNRSHRNRRPSPNNCIAHIQKRYFHFPDLPIDRRYRLLFMGAPGVGKGTFSKLIASEFNAQIMTSGDLIRAAARMEEGTAHGTFLHQCIAAGQLVPDNVVVPMVINFLRTVENSFILDGFPRTIRQAERIHREYSLDLALSLNLPDHILLKKALGRRVCEQCGANYNVADINEPPIIMPSLAPEIDGICDRCTYQLSKRVDDTKEVVLERLQVYHGQARPILDFYRDMGLLLEFDVKTGINDTAEIVAQIKHFLATAEKWEEEDEKERIERERNQNRGENRNGTDQP